MFSLKGKTMIISGASGDRPDPTVNMALACGANVCFLSGNHERVIQAMKYIDKVKNYHGARLLRGVILYEGAPGVTKNQVNAYKELEQSAYFLYFLDNSKRSLKALFDRSKDKYTEVITNKACRYLGICYEKGIGVTGNLNTAIAIWLKNSTDAESIYKLGYYTEHGRYRTVFVRGVQKPNYNLAREFYRMATDLGHAQAKAALQRLGN